MVSELSHTLPSINNNHNEDRLWQYLSRHNVSGLDQDTLQETLALSIVHALDSESDDAGSDLESVKLSSITSSEQVSLYGLKPTIASLDMSETEANEPTNRLDYLPMSSSDFVLTKILGEGGMGRG